MPRVACYLSLVSVAEIRLGIERAPDPAVRAELDTADFNHAGVQIPNPWLHSG